MGALDKLNDMSWGMLDSLYDKGIPLADYFDKYRIPAVVFPILILLVILLVVWMFAMPAAPAAECGDNICSPAAGETAETCPEDCLEEEPGVTPGGFTLIVQVAGSVTDPITVTLLDSDENIIASQSGQKTSFAFSNTAPQILKAVLDCPSGKTDSSRPRVMTASDPLIALTVPSDCFATVSRQNPDGTTTEISTPVYGSIEATILDSNTMEPISNARVSAMRLNDNIPDQQAFTTGDGTALLNVYGDTHYYLSVKAEGYVDYSGIAKSFYLLQGDEVRKDVLLDPLASTGQTGELTVCATDGEDPLSEGTITLYDMGEGNEELDEADLGEDGCASFVLPAGIVVRAALTDAPEGCINIASDAEEEVTITADEPQAIDIETSCGGTATVKVRVLDMTSTVVTSDVTVTLWVEDTADQIPGSASDSSLAYDIEGYTEVVEVPAGVEIFARATGAPVGYADTDSASFAFSPDEDGMIDIILQQTAIEGEFTFLGASVFYTPATPGSPVKIFVQQILYQDSVEITDENGEVEIIIVSDGEESSFEAEYVD